MKKPNHIITTKLGRRVYMAVNLLNEEMAFEGEPKDILTIFKKLHNRKPISGKEFADWSREFMWENYFKILKEHKKEVK